MENISKEEAEVLDNLHLNAVGIRVTAHVPQSSGECHPFDFIRGVLSDETLESAYARVQPDILHIIH